MDVIYPSIVFWGIYSLFIMGRKFSVNVLFPVNIEFSKQFILLNIILIEKRASSVIALNFLKRVCILILLFEDHHESMNSDNPCELQFMC